MTIERENAASEMPEQNERLLPGHKLLLAGPDFLTSFGFTEKINKKLREKRDFDGNVFIRYSKNTFQFTNCSRSLLVKKTQLSQKQNSLLGKILLRVPNFNRLACLRN